MPTPIRKNFRSRRIGKSCITDLFCQPHVLDALWVSIGLMVPDYRASKTAYRTFTGYPLNNIYFLLLTANALLVDMAFVSHNIKMSHMT